VASARPERDAGDRLTYEAGDRLTYEEASARTVSIVDEHLLGGSGGVDHALIGELLRRHRVRLVASRRVAASSAGQELILTGTLLIRRMGIAVEVGAPDALLRAKGPPFAGDSLHDALRSVADQILPGTEFRLGASEQTADVEFVLGSSQAVGPAARVLHVGVGGSRALVTASASDLEVDEHARVAALAAAGLVAAQAFRSFAARLAAELDVEVAKDFRFEEEVELDVAETLGVDPGAFDAAFLGDIDFISAGAITNASLYTLLRVGAQLSGRTIERKDLDPPDLNRYLLALARHLDLPKVDVLAETSTEDIRLAGRAMLYNERTRDQIQPLANTVAVGVDHVPSRWLVQSEEPRLLVVGATEGFEAYASYHRPGTACAGCLHPNAPPDEATRTVATISFVSFFAGFFQALLLAALANGQEPKGQVVRALPFAFAGAVVSCTPLAANPGCPVACPASRLARAA
jgi:molybdopterin/thiamine biosynthesis adenylyltransferase